MQKIKTKKGGERVENIVVAARELFLNNGFTNTPLSEIVQKSGGSLSTIYEKFGNKDGLFCQVIKQMAAEILADINGKISINESDDLEKFLLKFAEIYVDLVFENQFMLLKKTIFSEITNKNTQFFHIFHEKIIEPGHQILVDFFSKEKIRSKFGEQNLKILAIRFCFILAEPFSTDKIVFGRDFSMDKNERKKWAKECVEFFLNGLNGVEK